jgi:hypothetical protein
MKFSWHRRAQSRTPRQGKPVRPKRQSNREQEFLAHWISLNGPRLIPQHRFHPTRRWAFDWAHPESRVAIEIHGGIWMHKSRHVSGSGFWGDRIKMNAALRLDWKVFELTSDDLSDPRIYSEILDEIQRRLREGIPTDRDGLEPFAEVYPDRKHRSGQGHLL